MKKKPSTLLEEFKAKPYGLRALEYELGKAVALTSVKLYVGEPIVGKVSRVDYGEPHHPCRCDGSFCVTRIMNDAGVPVVKTSLTRSRVYMALKNGDVLVAKVRSRVADVLDNPRDRRKNKTLGLPVRILEMNSAERPSRLRLKTRELQGPTPARGKRSRVSDRINYVRALDRRHSKLLGE